MAPDGKIVILFCGFFNFPSFSSNFPKNGSIRGSIRGFIRGSIRDSKEPYKALKGFIRGLRAL